MDKLRTITALPWLALVWFVLSIGVVSAAPLVHPQRVEMICGGGTIIKLVQSTDEGMVELDTTAMYCALCMPTGAPPPHPLWPSAAAPSPLAYAAQSIPAARIAAATAAPLPARGPPVHS
ncbi:hypothetical protein PSQ40_14430 [Curvibacter sp. HBC61]|uniref:DUF2946 domain-containing protein n=1 Tax=Curvibacter cyanobacteriorum TaxID=3026422 RepID=A0ABT5N0C5_9BURK|nr:hypothetical protein [Curvibacter sp. HBC61]MDD0839778.1 hypothetical protein [Curvibacter sp. HBC61]